MNNIKTWIQIVLCWLGTIAIIIGVGYVIYLQYAAYDLVGKKVNIDGKTLTITASYQGEVIISDRTRINVALAKQLLVVDKSKDEK